MDLAEDVMQDSILEALNHWPYKGIPEDPTAWLFRVAKNKAINLLNRETYQRRYSSEVVRSLPGERMVEPDLEHLFSPQEIMDDQLRMLFTCCHPAISKDSQIALSLKTLCGFSLPEIAKAFLSTEENIKKRLVRARQKIREDQIPFDLPKGKNLDTRLQTVLETILLLFNEGYSASKGNDIIRYELCEEAIHLAEMIAGHEKIGDKANVYALLSLMYLNASRFKARQDQEGHPLTLAEQDRSLWDLRMQEAGLTYLRESAMAGTIGPYPILSAISAQYCIAADYESTDWKSILSLYDSLVQIDNSPIVKLNRAIALSKVSGPEDGLAELEKIQNEASIRSYHLFYSTKAELYLQVNQFENASCALVKAIELATLGAEKILLHKKLMGIPKK